MRIHRAAASTAVPRFSDTRIQKLNRTCKRAGYLSHTDRHIKDPLYRAHCELNGITKWLQWPDGSWVREDGADDRDYVATDSETSRFSVMQLRLFWGTPVSYCVSLLVMRTNRWLFLLPCGRNVGGSAVVAKAALLELCSSKACCANRLVLLTVQIIVRTSCCLLQ